MGAAVFMEFSVSGSRSTCIHQICTGLECRQITLACGRVALVDADQFDQLSVFRWHAHINGDRVYAIRRTGRVVTLMHRQIMGAKQSQIVDHRNGDTLDNRRDNLRIVTSQQNSTNQRPSGVVPFSGVTRRKGGRYGAAIWPNGHNVNLGTNYPNAESAAAVYNAAAMVLYGEYARLNPVEPDEHQLMRILACRLNGWRQLASAMLKREGSK